jgi:hypothetical protein
MTLSILGRLVSVQRSSGTVLFTSLPSATGSHCIAFCCENTVTTCTAQEILDPHTSVNNWVWIRISVWWRSNCTLTDVFLTLTEVFLCFFLNCKANARVKLAKTGHGPHSPILVVICVVWLLFVLFCVLFVCKCVLPPGDNPTAVNKYINIKKTGSPSMTMK